MREKVIVIGVDGGTFRLLKPWMDHGQLPHLKHIMDHGVSGQLTSSIPPVTVPAFPCFMTGKNPGKHGIASFFGSHRSCYEEIPVDSTFIASKTLWEILSEDGRKVAVLNVPATYPIRPVNGVIISGLMTPEGKTDFAYPPGLLGELEDKFGSYRTDSETPLYLLLYQSPTAIEKILQNAHDVLDYRFSVAEYLMEKDDFDFFMVHVFETDQIQHWLWNILDATDRRYDKGLAEKYYDQILGYYRALDSRIGRMALKAGPEATVIIMSDHGFGPSHKGVDLNAWLLQEGYLKIKGDLFTQSKCLLWRMGWNPRAFSDFARWWWLLKVVQGLLMRTRSKKPGQFWRQLGRWLRFFPLSLRDVNWARSRAYCMLTGSGQIRINLAGRETQGIVKPGKEYEALRDEIIEKLKELCDPETGKRINAQVLAKEEIYTGEHTGDLPDITFLPEENEYVAWTSVTLPGPRVFIDNIWFRGYHRMDGILLINGRPIRNGGKLEGASIVDLAPTILYLMGSKIPSDMDGRVLIEILKDGVLKDNPIEFVGRGEEKAMATHRMSKEDEESIIQRLKGLGYIS